MKVIFKKNGKSIFAKIIRVWTLSKYSHVELVFSDGMAFSSDEADNGTRYKKIDINDTDWDVLNIPCTPEQERYVRDFCDEENGLKYDKIGICFSFLPIPIGWQSANKWFCSEFCTAAVQRIGYLVGYTPARISPKKMFKFLSKELKQRMEKAK